MFGVNSAQVVEGGDATAEIPLSVITHYDPASRAILEEMLVTPIQQLTSRAWTKETAADLRRALNRLIEEHVERKLRTLAILEAL